MSRFIKIHKDDTVATALDNMPNGKEVQIFDGNNNMLDDMITLRNIPMGNKIALLDIKKGDNILKYGVAIGIARGDIKRGDLVHVHNVSSCRAEIPEEFKNEIMKRMEKI